MKKFLATILSVVLLLTIVPMAYAEESNTYKVGDIIQFGSYPQSEVKDKNLIAELNALAPEWDDWTSYGYYTGTGKLGSMFNGDWMRCVDIKHDDIKYRGVKFTQCRPNWTFYISSNTDQDDNGYSTNTVYWFIFESIDWRVLDPSTGLVLCETIIDAQPYSNTVYYNRDVSDSRYAYFNDFFSYKNYASDYETSSIRKWLNEDFYNIAFTDSEKKEISITTLNNDGYYTSNGTTGYEELDSNETKDKIFLLSYNEVKNSKFGFNPSSSAYDVARFGKGSDYAQSQGLYKYRSSGSPYNGNSCWLLRSPGDYSYNCCIVGSFGCYNNNFVYDTSVGVRPALNFNQISDIGKPEHQHSYTTAITTEPTHLKEGVKTFTCECGDTYTEVIAKLEGHTYNKVVTAPTCTTQGYTTYTCECGNAYIEPIAPTGHDFDGSKCKNCDYDKADDCSCNCHKGGFMGFIWKIINFFNKLFKSNQICSCGAKHW